MPINAFPKLRQRRGAGASIADTILRDFSGGLKVTENQTALKSKYTTKLHNLLPDFDSSQVLRFGTKLFADLDESIVGMTYFRDRLIVVVSDGEVLSIANDGTATSLGDSWTGTTTQVDFSEFRDNLIICNGANKPLIVNSSYVLDWLEDLGTGSNVNTPIGKYVTTVSNFLVIAGIAAEPTTIYISSEGTSGTWPGDPAPNNALSFDVGAYTGQASSDIRGIASFKNFLLVFFDGFSVAMQLGVFNESGVHTPKVIDTYPTLGSINHKTFVTLDKDLVFISRSGLYSAEKNVFGGTLQTEGMSDDLGADYLAAVGVVARGDGNSFLVNDPLSKVMFLMLHQEGGSKKIFAMRYNEKMTKRAWGECVGWEFTCAATSMLGRVFFAKDDKIYQYGNEVFDGEDYAADFITDESEGSDISFDWELPWLDGGNRIKTKILRRLAFETSGDASFTVQCFVNNFTATPVTSMAFAAGEAGGYGNIGYGDGGFGGGRRANDERGFGTPVRFRILKLRLFGATKKRLRFSSIGLIYARGNYNV